VIAQRSAELDAADRKLQRSEQLIGTNAVPQQVLDDVHDRRK
jgi:HlyD family secretion protein